LQRGWRAIFLLGRRVFPGFAVWNFHLWRRIRRGLRKNSIGGQSFVAKRHIPVRFVMLVP